MPNQPVVFDAAEAGGAALRALPAPCESRVAVLTYGNGVPKALEARVASGVAADVDVDVIDCPLLSRLPDALPALLRGRYESLLLVDVCREGAGPL